jgi:hypothetical protein
MQPDTRFAKSGDVHIAYQVFGEGSLNVVFAPPAFTNVEHWWDEPEVSRWLLRLASYARVVMFDKRGTGLSDRVADFPGLDQRMDDLWTVMDAAGMEQAALMRRDPHHCGFALDGHDWDGIYLGRRKGNDLIYAGKVDHGFDKQSSAELRKRPTPLIRKTQPYAKRIAHKGIWVEPELLAEIEYRAKSAEGKVRHPFYKGLREDL